MNKFEFIHIILTLLEQNEIDKAKKMISEKQQELRLAEVKSVREEINEIIRSIKDIDKELLIFKLKKMKLYELCPDVSLNLQGYFNQLEKTRARLVKQKMMLAKQKG
ncbi:hypothetical protein [Lysinibacillus sp. C5.1]|uniref:hypothetical protein n=1 Tax=Lysinibacillus sp. C5.1 TaxID=2796169 RepID=UPI0030813E03